MPVLLWMTIIFSLSAIESEDMEKIDIPNIDKFFHFIEYFVLGILLVRAFSNSFTKPNFIYILIASILISLAYAFTDEYHQSFVPGRTPDIFDVLSDIIGAAMGAALSLYKEKISRAGNKTV